MARPIWARWIDPSSPEEVLLLALAVRELVITCATPAEFHALARRLRREGLAYPWLPVDPLDMGGSLSGAERVALHSLRRRLTQFLDVLFSPDDAQELSSG